jgi:hypothetical protein
MDLGRRSWFMILFSILYLGVAYGAYLQIINRPPLFIHEMLPPWVRAGMWLFGATLGFTGALLRNFPRLEQYGFAGLCIPVAIRVVSYGIGMIFSIFNIQNHDSFINGFTGFVTFGVFMAAILLVASWPEPHPEALRKALKYQPGQKGEPHAPS